VVDAEILSRLCAVHVVRQFGHRLGLRVWVVNFAEPVV
jgi:hypothetical protein